MHTAVFLSDGLKQDDPNLRGSGWADVAKWTAIQYRFGPEDGPPELLFPKSPSPGRPPLFFSHEESGGDYRMSVRFSNGGYSYRVSSGSKSGAGVEVANANGKRITVIEVSAFEYERLAKLEAAESQDTETVNAETVQGVWHSWTNGTCWPVLIEWRHLGFLASVMALSAMQRVSISGLQSRRFQHQEK